MKDVYHMISVIMVCALAALLAHNAMRKARYTEHNKPYLRQMGQYEAQVKKADRLMILALAAAIFGEFWYEVGFA